MFLRTLPNSDCDCYGDIPIDRPDLREQAVILFSKMLANGKLHRVINSLKRKSKCLLDQSAHRCAACISNQHYVGRQIVPIDLIQGSEGRALDFDDAFYPLSDRLRSRWLGVASARLAGKGLPPVELIKSCGVYYVRDGHHRISVARALGEMYIDAEVIVETC